MNPSRTHALTYGLYGALVLIVIGLIGQLTGLVDPSQPNGGGGSMVINVLNALVTAGALVLAVKKHRDEDLDGYIAFGKAFGLGMLTVVVIAIISGIWTFVYISFIDPEMIDIMKEAARAQMENQGMEGEQLEQAMAMNGKFMNPGMISVFAILGSMFFGLIISLVVAAVMKKQPSQGIA
ncbi:MAG: DUF4199 domain-containing protein [Saprospiraceae bacterium]|jgi:hypothetical protein